MWDVILVFSSLQRPHAYGKHQELQEVPREQLRRHVSYHRGMLQYHVEHLTEIQDSDSVHLQNSWSLSRSLCVTLTVRTYQLCM